MTPSRFINWLSAPVFLIAVACGGTSKFRGDSDAEDGTVDDGIDLDAAGDVPDAEVPGDPEDEDGPCTCASDEDCIDGLVCNGDETCDGCYCRSGAAVDCGDGVECTVDTCLEPDATCQSVPDSDLCGPDEICDVLEGCVDAEECVEDGDCLDGFYCNGEEICGETDLCEGGTAVECDDGYSCTVDACDEDADDCSFTPVDLSCDDALYCTVDACDPASTDPAPDADGCIFAALDCSDTVSCTVDTCDDGADACVHTADDGACSDGLFCTLDVCDVSAGCTNPALDCSDSVSCTVDSCDEEADACVNAADDAACSDGLFCTDDVCDVSAGCTNPATDCSDTVSCTVDTCDEGGDACVHTADDGACSDGLFCTDDVCDVSAGCTNPATDCSDTVSCTVDTCDEGGDACVHTADDGACSDGLFCTLDVCDVSAGCTNPTRDCTDAYSCTVDSCDEGGDACVNTPDAGRCGDGLRCTTDSCSPGSSGSGSDGCLHAPVVCASDGLDCTDDACVETGTLPCPYAILAGYCVIPDLSGAPTCYASGDPNPLNECLICDPTTDATDWTPVAFGVRCNDGISMTVLDHCDGSGTCIACHRSMISPGGGSGTIAECSDSWDNDGNNLFDWPDDPGCSTWTASETGLVSIPTQCSNGIDDDVDGTVDFGSDAGCATAIDNWESVAHPPCNDALDNDGDTLVDFPDDPGCVSLRDVSEVDPGMMVTACSDVLDNDMDSVMDFSPPGGVPDPGCSSAMDNSEFDCDVLPMCSDGIDNDGDGLTDYPDDPGCFSLRDDVERNISGAATECSDGIDNDGDGTIDTGGSGIPADTDCGGNPMDNAEYM